MTRRFLIALIWTATRSTNGLAADLPTLPTAASRDIDFVRDIQPIFRTRCHACHDAAKQRGGLRLDLKSAALRGGESFAPAIVPGKSADSPLVRFVAGLEEGMQMPPEGERLSAEQIGLLRAWIDQGAKWPDNASGTDDAASHWSFRPVVRPELPSVSRELAAWARNPIDVFVLAVLVPSPPSVLSKTKTVGERTRVRGQSGENASSNTNDLRSESPRFVAPPSTDSPPHPNPLPPKAGGEGTGQQIAPSAEADRVTLIRRLSFDLLGLSPAPEEVAEFVTEARPDAYERLVDRLLASPHFGERWARHWLDVVRFAESDGFETNQPRPNAWPYRDYVIRAFNEDKPFEQFVTEQLAGDLLGADEATGFIVGGTYDRVKSPDPGLTAQQRSDELHDMVSTTGSAFLGLTVGCARCHNHKFDPISQVDYYSMKAVFAGVQHGERPLPRLNQPDREQQIARVKTELDEIERALWAFEPLAVVRNEPPVQRDDSVRRGSSDPTSVRRGSPDPAETPDRRSPLRSNVPTPDQQEKKKETSGPAPVRGQETRAQQLRAAVQRRTNIDRFAPALAKFVRLTVDETNNGSQPCLDEVEIFTTEAKPQNVALAAHGTKVTSSSNLPGYEIHQLKHVNDGRYGNSASWISNEAGRGWVLFELPEAVEIDRVLWSRDRPADGKFSDRIATKYRIEIGTSADNLHVVATADDRQPIGSATAAQPARVTSNEQERTDAERLIARQASLNETLRQLTMQSQVYAGRFVNPEPTHRFHRGDPLQPKEPVAPASLASFGSAWSLPLDAPEASRRQQLAKWITDPQHPLTARVLVNRFWHSHFGQGLVTTPSDFGRNGALPSHPELLDWLSAESAERGALSAEHEDLSHTSPSVPHSQFRAPSSSKRLHRLIVNSATYRQSSAARPEAMQADAGTRLLWRYPPRRLEAEPLRDAILAVCGNLDDRMSGPGFDLFEPNTNYVKVYNSKKEFGPADWRRMVYQSKPRMQLDDTFGQFDCPDAGQITPKRTSSITALQALNLLNSRFIVQQSSLFANRLEREAGPDANAQVRRAYSLTFLRSPTDDEQTAAVEFAKTHGLPALCRALLNTNEFLFVF